MKSSIEYKTAE